MLVELLRPMGPELARRWLAALLMVDEKNRVSVVAAVERQLVDLADTDADSDGPAAVAERELRLVSPPVARDGFVEQKITTYAVKAAPVRRARGKRVS